VTDRPQTCPTCGEYVEVVGSDEGTHYYSSVSVKRLEQAEAELRVVRERLAEAGAALRIACVRQAGDEVGIDEAQRLYDEYVALAGSVEPR